MVGIEQMTLKEDRKKGEGRRSRKKQLVRVKKIEGKDLNVLCCGKNSWKENVKQDGKTTVTIYYLKGERREEGVWEEIVGEGSKKA